MSPVLQRSILNSPVSRQKGVLANTIHSATCSVSLSTPKEMLLIPPIFDKFNNLINFCCCMYKRQAQCFYLNLSKHVLGVFPLFLFDFPRLKFSHFQSLDNVNPYSYKRHANFIFKELSKSHLKDHIEADHLEDISHTRSC